MSEVKLTQEELQSIRAIAEQETATVTQLGNVEFQLNALKNQKELILNSIKELGDKRLKPIQNEDFLINFPLLLECM